MLSILGKIFLYSRDENILAINKTKHDHKSRSEFVLNTNCQLSKLYWTLSASCMGIKFRRYADRSMRQMKTSQFDYFDDVCGKKFMKCPRVLSLLRAKGMTLVNKQSTILCVSRQQIFIILCEFSPDLREAAKPPLNNLFPNR